jgi:hypothetical protein
MTKRKAKGFRYEAQWAMENGYKDVIHGVWTQSSSDRRGWEGINSKLLLCQNRLKCWRSQLHDQGTSKIAHLHARLRDLHNSEVERCGNRIMQIRKELQELMEKADLHWRQRAKIEWLKSGDHNTRYYHACATSKNKKNKISSIVDGDNRNCAAEEEVK